MHRNLLLFVVIMASVAQAAGGSADVELPNEADFFLAPPIVLSASRLAQPLSEAPAAVTVIDREMIETSGFTDIANLLRLVPGFQVGLSTMKNSTAVTYHGQSDALPRRMEVLVDGRSVYNSLLSVDWHDLGVTLADVDHIEVVRGSNSPSYGSNAFIATVNIITRPRYADPGWFAQATSGSTATRVGTLRHVGKVGGFDYRLSLGYDQSDNFPNRNDEQLLRTLNFRGWYDLGDTDSLEVQVGGRKGSLGRGGDEPLFNPFGPKLGNNAVASDHEKLRWNHVIGGARDTSVQLYHQRYREDDNATAGLLSGILGVAPALIPAYFPGHEDEVLRSGLSDYRDERTDLEWQYNDASDERLHWTFGAGLRQDKLRSLIILGRNDYVQERVSRIFTDASYRLDEGWLLNLGGLLEQGGSLDRAISYRLALNRQVSPNQTVRASVTHSLRNRGLFDRYLDMGLHFSNGDPVNVVGHTSGELEPEDMLAWEVGWLGNWLERRLTLNAKLFREEIRREIISLPGLAPEPYPDGAQILGNGGGVNITGLEGQLQYRPSAGNLAMLQFSLDHAEDRYDPVSTGLASEAGRTPRLTLSLLLAHTFSEDVQLSLGYYHVDRMRWQGAAEVAAGKPSVPAYNRVDLRLAKRLSWSGQDVLLELIVQNIGNRAYQEFMADNQFDTRYFLRTSVQFR